MKIDYDKQTGQWNIWPDVGGQPLAKVDAIRLIGLVEFITTRDNSSGESTLHGWCRVSDEHHEMEITTCGSVALIRRKRNV